MELKKLPWDLTVCKVASVEEIDLRREFFFLGKTDEEISLVCRTEETPERTCAREDGWRAFRVQGVTASASLPFPPSTRTTSWSRQTISRRPSAFSPARDIPSSEPQSRKEAGSA